MYYLLLLNLICPFVMVLVSILLKKHPTHDPSSNNGYSTPTARKSPEHWRHAQSVAPGIFLQTGFIAFTAELLLSIALYYLKIPIEVCIALGLALGLAALRLAFLRTDREVDRNNPS